MNRAPAEREPCAKCGTTSGKPFANSPNGGPGRVVGTKFGFSDKLCIDCYNKVRSAAPVTIDGETLTRAQLYWRRHAARVKVKRQQRRDLEPGYAAQLKEYAKRYRQGHPELFRAYWVKANKKHAHNQRARRRNVFVERVDGDMIAARDKNHCGICGRYVKISERSLDHIVPIARGGLHVGHNVQLAHRRCNWAKGAGRLPSQIRLAV